MMRLLMMVPTLIALDLLDGLPIPASCSPRWVGARLWRLTLLADIRGYWDLSADVAMALQAVSGVERDSAQLVPTLPFLPWLHKKWVHVPPAVPDDDDESVAARSRNKAAASARTGKGGGLSKKGALSSSSSLQSLGASGTTSGSPKKEVSLNPLDDACVASDPSAHAIEQSIPSIARKVRKNCAAAVRV
jgi:hypothetical protein